MDSLFDIPSSGGSLGEQTEILVDNGFMEGETGFKLEKIVSFGNATPEGEWYDQNWTEWVMVAKGMARLMYGDGRVSEMSEGDWVVLKRHEKHRVEWVSDDCVWLALHHR